MNEIRLLRRDGIGVSLGGMNAVNPGMMLGSIVVESGDGPPESRLLAARAPENGADRKRIPAWETPRCIVQDAMAQPITAPMRKWVQNREREGEWSMESGSLPHGKAPAEAAAPEWLLQIATWRDLLDECLRKPTRGRVHALRVSTLRLQSDIPHWLVGCVQGEKCARAVKRWNRQAEKLRRALRPVRGADVDLGRLGRLRDLLAEPGEGRIRSSRRCLRQIDQLARRFRQLRRAAQKELVAEMMDRRERLRRTSLALEMALAPLDLNIATKSSARIHEQLAALASEFPELSEDNLHEFRMRIKAVRYLADLSSSTDAYAARQAAAMGRMQVAAGEWHDLKMLSKKAEHELGSRNAKGGLVELLDELAAESLQKALALCRRTTAQLLKPEAQKAARPKAAVLKFPVQRAGPEAAPAKEIRA